MTSGPRVPRLTALLLLGAALAAPRAGAQTISSVANQTFTVGDASTIASAITITDTAGARIKKGGANELRIVIPATLAMIWDTTVTTVTITGSAAGKVGTTVTYESANSIVHFTISSTFAAGDWITVSGLAFAGFTAAGGPGFLGVQVLKAGSPVGNDNRSKTIVPAAPTISSAANQTFTVGDPTTAMTSLTITDASTPTITTGNDIRIRIPAGLNMTWDPTVTTATITGGAAGKMSTTVTYTNVNSQLILHVNTSFAGNDQIVVSGLKFTSFTATSAASNLGMAVGGAGSALVATDTKTKTIVAPPTLVGAANQTFTVGDPATAMTSVTVTDASTPTITAANDIRIRIPAGFNMTWNTGITTATITGAALAKVSTTVTYENAGQVVVLNVTSNFVAGDQITVSGLQFTSFTATSAANNLQLVVSGSAGGGTAALNSTTQQIVQPTISSAAIQAFVVAQAATAMSAITVTDNATAPTITAVNDIRIRVPAGFNMTWNTALTTATIGGAAAAKVSTTVSYENAGQVLVLNVTSNFAAGDQMTVSGLQFTAFTAAAAVNNLQLVVSGAGGGTAATDNRTIAIVAPTLVGVANQTFTVGDPATAMTSVTITDATTPTITAVNDIRIRIPAGFNMMWNTGITTATITGAALAKVSTTVTYENAGQVLVLNVTSNFVAGDQIVVSGLQFTSFTAISAADFLQLVVSGSAGGGTAALSSTTQQIVQPTISSAANQTFVVAQAATAMSTITVTDNATAATITAANDIRIRIPAGFTMTWNTGITTATIAGAALAKVSTTVTYENAGQVVVLNVTANFVAGDQITVSGLQFTAFTAASAVSNLQLVVSGAGGGTAGTDNRTIIIVAPALSSAASKTFSVGDPATAMATATVTDNATAATITAVNDIRIRIPAGFSMTWNTALTTATIGGAAAAKVSTTVSYENAGQVLVVNVTSNFAAGDQITISGLQFTSFTAAAAANNLQLAVSGVGGGTAASDDKTVTITTTSVLVSPHATTASQLPSNGTNYTVVFTAENTGAAADSYDLLTTKQPGTALTTISIAGAGITQGANPDSARLASLAASATATVTVTYSVGSVALGATDTLTLKARSVSSSTHSDNGRMALTVTRPSLSVSKGVNPSGTQPPATNLTYTITLTNGGTSSANGVVLVDSLSSALQFKVGSIVSTLPVAVVVAYSNNSGTTWTYIPASGACSAPAGYDRCVNRVRWTLQANLSSTGPNNTGTVQLIAQIR